ncbi:efflux RND transporter periplasmic adaptor subunit [Neptunicella marina]|uniref:Efflux RND transporter periplasmic adaptor subunit n=1 Tax=Neptunicella marina TaxID=2125989 RepID=A0A8J6IX70_9ALTE|nr:efflux RND transporter periplasmic adaptor subunit [Neptunicella marina]MBC3766993.1 efflux RND transporter periplasmic adaptor subunit [Neptunicella marina]
MKISDTSGQDVVLSPKNKSKKYLLAGAVAVALLAGSAFVLPGLTTWSSAEASINAERIRTAVVTRGDFVRDLSVQGQVVAAVSPRLYSTAQGTITFKVDAGDQVKKGQVLAIIDSPELTNQLKQEESSELSLKMDLDRQRIQAKKQALENQKEVDMAKVSLTAADREKRRADAAYKTNAISQIDFEKAQDELENAKLVYKHAVEDAQLNKESLNFEIQTMELKQERQSLLVKELTRKVNELTLRSPVDGLVGNLAVEQKNQVAKNQPILSVVDLSEFELEVAIPESYADDLNIGMEAEVTLNGETHLAKLVTISPEIENNQVTGRVRFAAQSPAGLRQNQRLTTRILMENKSDVLMVQRGQFLESGNGKVAYVVRDGVAERRRINTGARSLSSVEVIDGLNAGDQIIISGLDQFQGAQTVLINN